MLPVAAIDPSPALPAGPVAADALYEVAMRVALQLLVLR
jgi:hypothetical protein